MQMLYLDPTTIERDPEGLRDQDGDVTGLIETIRTYGLLQPLGVIEYGAMQYRVVYGGRRLRAALELGLDRVPCVLVDTNSTTFLMQQATENMQRLDLNDLEKAEAFRRIRDLIAKDGVHLSEGELDERTGQSMGIAARTVRRYLGLLQLPPEVQALLRSGELTVTHAQHLRRIAQPQAQIALARMAAEEGLSAADVSNLANYFAANPTVPIDQAIQALQAGAQAPPSHESQSVAASSPAAWGAGIHTSDDELSDDEPDDTDDLDMTERAVPIDDAASRTRARVFRIKSLDQMVDETERLARTYQEGELQKWVTDDESAALKIRLLARQLRSFVANLENLANERGWEL